MRREAISRFTLVALWAVASISLPACTRESITSVADARVHDTKRDGPTTPADLSPSADAKLWDGQPENCGSLDRPCFTGAAFADCGEIAPGGPVLHCSGGGSVTQLCRWVSDGCPTAAYPWPFAGCTRLADSGPGYGWPSIFLAFFGQAPWTRDRGAVIEASIDDVSTPPDPIDPLLRCENTGAAGWPSYARTPCVPGGEVLTEPFETFDTFAYFFGNAGHGETWVLMVEVDTGRSPAVARICRLTAVDQLSACEHDLEVPCAEGGAVTLARYGGVLHLIAFRGEFPGGAVVASRP